MWIKLSFCQNPSSHYFEFDAIVRRMQPISFKEPSEYPLNHFCMSDKSQNIFCK